MVPRSTGFTLLEIMIALAIVSIAMVSLLGLANRSIKVHDRLQHITKATFLAQSVMADTEFKASQERLNKGFDEGTFTEPNEIFRWQISFDETPLPSVTMVSVRVLWGDASRNEYVELTSFIF